MSGSPIRNCRSAGRMFSPPQNLAPEGIEVKRTAQRSTRIGGSASGTMYDPGDFNGMDNNVEGISPVS